MSSQANTQSSSTLPPNPAWPRYVGASAAWHGAMAVGALVSPAAWPFWLSGVALNHGLLCAASMLPRSSLIGPNITRLPPAAVARREVCLTFDDGPDPNTTPAVLAMLEQAGARASFFCIGDRVTEHPELARRIVAAGHSIENHTRQHRHDFAFRTPGGLRREIGEAQRQIEQTVGKAPIFFRAPAGMRNPFLQPVLAGLDLRLASWTRRGFDTIEKRPDQVLERLTKRLAAGDLLLLHDGHAAHDTNGQPVLLTVLPALLAALAQTRLKAVSLPMAFT